MAGRSWLVDSNRIASKIKSASGLCDPERVTWKSNPTRACPNCQNVIDNSDDLFHPYLDLDIPKLIQHPGMLSKHRNVAHEWPGLPRGVKFDPSDQEIIWHLLAKVGIENFEPHPFIDEFIPTVDEDDGICYTHPQKLPGVKQDGTVSHFFHRAINAYNTGTRKRRKIQGDDIGDVRWHKTGRTKPVILDGVQRGCKKIMVLYLSPAKGGKSEKTNWVMHQYHLGTGEDEKDREYVISKIFYQQQQQPKQGDKNEAEYAESADGIITKADPVTPKPVIPNPPRTERQCSELNLGHDSTIYMNPVAQHHEMVYYEDEAQHECEDHNHDIEPMAENHVDQMTDGNDNHIDQMIDGNDNRIDQTIDSNNNNADEDPKWWDSESQYLLDSQQLVEALSLCDDLLHSQSPIRDGNRDDRILENKPSLSDYAHLGPDALKKDLEACQNLVIDPANIELDTPPDFRLSQLDFGSQESFIAWGGGKVGD